jgi:hypothetical protein
MRAMLRICAWALARAGFNANANWSPIKFEHFFYFKKLVCSAVRIGHTGLTEDEIVANVLAVCPVIASHAPGLVRFQLRFMLRFLSQTDRALCCYRLRASSAST